MAITFPLSLSDPNTHRRYNPCPTKPPPLNQQQRTKPKKQNPKTKKNSGGGRDSVGGEGEALAETSSAAAWAAVLGAVQVLYARRLDAGRLAAVARVLLDALQVALVLLSPQLGWGLPGGAAAAGGGAAGGAAGDAWWRFVSLPLLHPSVEKLVGVVWGSVSSICVGVIRWGQDTHKGGERCLPLLGTPDPTEKIAPPSRREKTRLSLPLGPPAKISNKKNQNQKHTGLRCLRRHALHGHRPRPRHRRRIRLPRAPRLPRDRAEPRRRRQRGRRGRRGRRRRRRGGRRSARGPLARPRAAPRDDSRAAGLLRRRAGHAAERGGVPAARGSGPARPPRDVPLCV